MDGSRYHMDKILRLIPHMRFVRLVLDYPAFAVMDNISRPQWHCFLFTHVQYKMFVRWPVCNAYCQTRRAVHVNFGVPTPNADTTSPSRALRHEPGATIREPRMKWSKRAPTPIMRSSTRYNSHISRQACFRRLRLWTASTTTSPSPGISTRME